MSEFTSILERIRPGYVYGGKIKQGPQKGKHRFHVGRSPNIRNFYADTIEEGKAWEAKQERERFYKEVKSLEAQFQKQKKIKQLDIFLKVKIIMN